jgi:hypothetical protein
MGKSNSGEACSMKRENSKKPGKAWGISSHSKKIMKGTVTTIFLLRR